MEEPGRAGERRAEPSDSQNRGEAIEELKVIRRDIDSLFCQRFQQACEESARWLAKGDPLPPVTRHSGFPGAQGESREERGHCGLGEFNLSLICA